MNSSTENKTQVEKIKYRENNLYAYLRHEINAPSYGWAFFLSVLSIFPLLSYPFESIRNIFTVNISKLDYEVIIDSPLLWILKLVLPFLVSLFFYMLFSFIFFFIRDKGRKRRYFVDFFNEKSDKNGTKKSRFPFGFGISTINSKYQDGEKEEIDNNLAESSQHKFLLHNIISLAIIGNLVFWCSVMLVTLIHAIVAFFIENQYQLLAHQAFDIFMNGMILIGCSLIVIGFKPFFYSYRICRFILFFTFIVNSIASLMIFLVLHNADGTHYFSTDILAMLNLENTLIGLFLVGVIFLLSAYNIKKLVFNSDKLIKKLKNKSNERNGETTLTIIKGVLIVFLLLILLLSVGLLNGEENGTTIFIIFLITVWISILLFFSHRKKLIVYQNLKELKIGNIQFLFLIGFIIILSMMSPNAPWDMGTIFPEALYVLLIASSFSMLVLFIKSYFFTSRISLLIPLVGVIVYLSTKMEFEKELYITLFVAVTIVLYYLGMYIVRKSNPNVSKTVHVFQLFDSSLTDLKLRKTLNNLTFPFFLILALFIYNKSLPEPLKLYSSDESNNQSREITNETSGEAGDYIVVATAQGGGIAASAWTAKVLEELDKLSNEEHLNNLQNKLKECKKGSKCFEENKDRIDASIDKVLDKIKNKNILKFIDKIKAISAVSGGALGSYYFYANLNDSTRSLIKDKKISDFSGYFASSNSMKVEGKKNSEDDEINKSIIKLLDDITKHPVYNIASRNSLKAIMWGIANPMMATHKEAALVSRWVKDVQVKKPGEFSRINSSIGKNLSYFVDNKDDNNVYFIANAAYQETGRRVVLSNYPFHNVGSCDVENNSFDFDNALAKNDDIKGINAVLHSATFPYVTKTQVALTQLNSSRKTRESDEEKVNKCDYHLADGGYVDNYGVRSALDFIESYQKYENKDNSLKVLLLQINTFDASVNPDADSSLASTYIGPIKTLNSLRKSQKSFNKKLIEELNENPKITIKPVEFLYENEPNKKTENRLPLSWQLLPAHKRMIEERWGNILFEFVSGSEKKRCENPLIRLEEEIKSLSDDNYQNTCSFLSKKAKKPNVKSKHHVCKNNECELSSQIKKDLKSIRDNVQDNKINIQKLLKRTENKISPKPQSIDPLMANFSGIINCSNDIVLSSEVFNKGEPEIKTDIFDESHFVKCKNCNKQIDSLTSNNNKPVTVILDNNSSDNTTWHILGLTSSDGDFNYNANLAERRIYYYKSALTKYYEKKGIQSPNIIEHPLGEIMSSLDDNQTEENRRKVHLIPCKNN